MIRALKTAALGMSAQQMNVDVIANNLANVNTTGFKRSSVEFQDLLYETIETSSEGADDGFEKPSEIQVGMGSRPISTYRSFTQGNVSQTGNTLDVAINGEGFIQVARPDGSILYTRDGALRINSDGSLVTNAGLKVFPEITVPDDATSIVIETDGRVVASYPGAQEGEELGQIELANFVNPAGLKAVGGNLFEASGLAGDELVGIPGEGEFGLLIQGYLEKSNVDVAQEMIDLIVAQRAYEINTKAIKTADELLSMTNNLRR